VQTELQQQFNDAFSRWKQNAKNAAEANNQFRICDADEADAFRQDWIDAIEAGRRNFRELLDVGLKRVSSETESDAELLAFLALVLESRYEAGDYDGAYEIGTAMLTATPNAPGLIGRVIFSSFATNQFAECQKRVRQLEELTGGVPVELQPIASAIDRQVEAWNKELELREAEAAADDLPRVELIIDFQGTPQRIVLELFENEAPNSVANFISLVKQGFYDGCEFFRVTTHFDAATGCPNNDGSGGPGYFIASEAQQENARRHYRGSLATIAGDAGGRAGSQFCIHFAPNPELEGRSTVFGRVVEGMDVVDRLTRSHLLDPQTGQLNKIPEIALSTIETAKVIRQREHEYVPVKLPE
jgi:cyclophilin family peptidyl-prolyl cis-trans isomerase